MHPDDMRNLMIFFVLVIGLYFVYDAFVQKPQLQAIKERKVAQEQLVQMELEKGTPAPTEIRDRAEVLSTDQRITIDNGHIKGSLSLKGGRIDDLSLSEYFKSLENKENVVLLSPKSTVFPRFIEYGWVAKEDNVNLPNKDTVWRVRGNTVLSAQQPVTLVWDNGQGLVFERKISIDQDYMFTIEQRVNNNSGRAVTLYPFGLVTQNGPPPGLQQRFILHEGPIGYVGDELVELSYKKLKKEPQKSRQSSKGWIGITDKYWLTGLIPAQDVNTKFSFHYVPSVFPDGKGKYQTDFLGGQKVVNPGQSADYTSHLFTGAKKVLTLKDYAEKLNIPRFDLAVDFGIFWFMTVPFFYALHYLGALIGNFGVAIILLTLVIRTAVFPLTSTSYRSFAKMKKVSPQIMELRERYGDDKTMLQQELVKMYQKEGVNPMAGCLPILLQIPIFFAFYKVLFVTIEMRHAPFFGWIQDLSAPDPTSVFNLFGLLPYDVPGFLLIGVWPCLMLVTMIIQKRLNPPPQDKLQRDMMNYFPFIITYVLAQFSAGLVIYWTVSAMLSVLQQMYIMRTLGVPIHIFGETEEEEKMDKAVDKGPALHPLSDMIEDDVEDALFDDEDEPSKPISPPKPKKKKKKK